MIDPLAGKQDAIAALCREYGVLRLDLFGSAAKGTFDPETSDLDFVYTYMDLDPGGRAHRFLEFVNSLESLFELKVDLVCERAVTNPYFREELAKTRRNIYLAPCEIAPPAHVERECAAAIRSRWMKQHLYTALAASRDMSKFTAGMNFNDYAQSDLNRDATTQKLCVLGHALHRLEGLQPGMVSREPALHSVMKLGVRISDDYRTVDYREIWDTAATRANELIQRTSVLLESV